MGQEPLSTPARLPARFPSCNYYDRPRGLSTRHVGQVNGMVKDFLSQEEIAAVLKLRNDFEKYKEDNTLWKRDTTRNVNDQSNDMDKLRSDMAGLGTFVDNLSTAFQKTRKSVATMNDQLPKTVETPDDLKVASDRSQWDQEGI